jgi:hypothetical protein
VVQSRSPSSAGRACSCSTSPLSNLGDGVLQAYAVAGARHRVGDRVALDFAFRDAVVLSK